LAVCLALVAGCGQKESETEVAAAREPSSPANPLPGWRDGAAREAIVSFVQRVTDKGSPNFVPAEKRIATFDNDGTLWVENPMYTQLAFALDRVRAMAPDHPEWKSTQPFKAVIENDKAALSSFGMPELMKLLSVSHSGMTHEEFMGFATAWADTAMHPRFHHRYTECVYQPMLELLAYLRSNGFKTYIVSGGGVDFMRAFSSRVYGIPPDQVIGSSAKTRFELRDGKSTLVKLPDINSIDDKEGKPVNIDLHIGQRPLLAFGNSDGDLAMLQYAADGPGARLALILHHDDPEREYAYDRDSHIGRLDQALDEAKARGWTVVSVKDDFEAVFPFDK
jgi:phosphoglycolate phosphatase-like HAD superfamily hydrolase